MLGSDVCLYEVPPHISEYRPIGAQTKLSACRNVEVTGVRCEGRAEGVKDNMSSFTPSPFLYISLLSPPHFYRPTARHPIIHTLTLKPFQSVLLCLTTSSTLCIPKRLYKSTQRFLSFNETPPLHLIPSSVPPSQNFADFQPSSPMFHSHMSTHSGHKLCISFHLCGIIHHNLYRKYFCEE